MSGESGMRCYIYLEPGSSHMLHLMSERRYVHFYDIFVRHAFGNFGDILREVTYSPAT